MADELESTEPIEPTPEEPIDPGMMTYGVLGYVTLDEASTYIQEHYTKADALRVSWEALDEADQAALLRKSFQTIESLPFTGRKTCCQQSTAFPRWPSIEVPIAIKSAQIENALVMSDTSASEDARQYEKMWQWGVSSYSIGNLSERLSEGAYGAGAAKATGIVSATATRLLAPFLQGGYRI